jgi:PKHD-type hydroxylase
MADTTWQLDTHEVNTYCYYDEVFSEEDLTKIEDLGASTTFEDARVATKILSARKTTVGWVRASEESSWLFRSLTDAIAHANNKWFNFDLNYIESLQFSVYNEGDFYEPHIDTAYQGLGQYPRKLSFTLQLTDPSEYEGGDVELITSGIPFPISKQRGTITFFPSYILHEVKPITKGTRKALVGWVHGPKWK